MTGSWPRRRTSRLAVLLVVLVTVSAVVLTPGCASYSARTSVARAYKTHSTALANIKGDSILGVIEELSSPDYAGRQAGSPGGRKAADYIAGQLTAMGVQPLIGDSYFQEFHIAYTHPVDVPVAVVRDAKGREVSRLQYGQDVAYSFWSDSADIANAPVVLVGSWDSIGDVDLTGRVALAVRPQQATTSSLYDGLEKARSAGALALLAADFDDKTLTSYWDVDTYVPGIAMLGLGGPAADLLLQNTGKNVRAWTIEAASAAKAGRRLEPVATGLTMDLRWTIDNDSKRAVRNVVGVIPGVRGIGSSKSLLLTAHYDHLGAIPGGPIWPGAWDNSSGVAVMLAAARMIATTQPDINVIVAAWDAEERGLVGSAYFAGSLPMPAESLIGIINLDCVGARLDFSLERSRAGNLTHRLESAAARYKIDMTEAPVKPWSDAASFTSIDGIEAIQIFDAGDPYQVPFLHDPSDTTANLRPDALERIARSVTLAIMAESEANRAK